MVTTGLSSRPGTQMLRQPLEEPEPHGPGWARLKDDSIMCPLETTVDSEGGRRPEETKTGDGSTFESGWDGRGDAASEVAIVPTETHDNRGVL